MKISGPPPQPPELKLLRGNPGHRPVRKMRNRPSPGATCPRALSAAARAEWKRLLPQLMRLGLLTRVDRAALASYCEAWSDFLWSVETLEKEGRTTIAGNGTLIPHPAFNIKRQAMQKLREFSAEFGFTPAARARPLDATDQEDKKDDSARFFTGPQPVPAPPAPRPARKRGR